MSLGKSHLSEAEIVVIGGGLIGTSVGLGLARRGIRTTILDEGDAAYRASRGNFALVWAQGKGFGMPLYAAWTKRAVDRWRKFADELHYDTGTDIGFVQPGGLFLALSENELERRSQRMQQLRDQCRELPDFE